jgi:hypothetical protein
MALAAQAALLALHRRKIGGRGVWLFVCAFGRLNVKVSVCQANLAMFSLSLISVLQESMPEDSLKIEVVNAQSLQYLCQQILISFVI